MFGSLFGKKGYDSLSLEDFQLQLEGDKDAVIIDVRTAKEFGKGHHPDARNLDIMSGAFEKAIDSLDPSKSYYLCCASGMRS